MKPLCIYHGGCDDGFAAAFIVRKALGSANVDFHPGVYDQPPPDVSGRDVIMVDFSYKRPVLEAMAGQANSILILDHHKTAAVDLAGWLEPTPWKEWRNHCQRWRDSTPRRAAIGTLFDMERSGAALAWDYFVGGERGRFGFATTSWWCARNCRS